MEKTQCLQQYWVGLVLSKKSYPQISDVKNYPEELCKNFVIQINATVYQKNDIMPLYFKNDKVFHSFSTPIYVKDMKLPHFILKKVM